MVAHLAASACLVLWTYAPALPRSQVAETLSLQLCAARYDGATTQTYLELHRILIFPCATCADGTRTVETTEARVPWNFSVPEAAPPAAPGVLP